MNIHENLIKRASRFLVEAPEDEINLDQPIEEPTQNLNLLQMIILKLEQMIKVLK